MSGEAFAVRSLRRIRRRRPPSSRTLHELIWVAAALVSIGKYLFIYFSSGKAYFVSIGVFIVFFVLQRRRYLRVKNTEDHDRLPLPVTRWEWGFLAFFWVLICWPGTW